MRPLLAPPLMALLMLAGLSGTASAAEYHVRDRDPEALAAAIRHANASPEADTIHLAEGGLYAIFAPADDQRALPVIEGYLRIVGHGAALRRYSDRRVSLIEVAEGAELRLQRLSLAEGAQGAIANRGRLYLEDVQITDSTAAEPPAIVINDGELFASRCEFSFNQLLGTRDISGALINRGLMRINDSLIAGNRVSRQSSTLSTGAVLNFGELTMQRVRFEDNRLTDTAGDDVLVAVINAASGQIYGDLDSASIHMLSANSPF
ncbi:MAG: hypothetical protein R3F22_07565 [Lysobacteraceae bacterium]